MSLDVQNFNLFGKKAVNTAKPVQKPISTPVTSKEVVDEEISKFDAEIETNEVEIKASPVIEPVVSKVIEPEIQIERFEEVKSASVKNSIAEVKLSNREVRSLEVNLKTAEKNLADANLRKFETFVAPTFRIPAEHELELKRVEQMIMKSRKGSGSSVRKERITSNTIVRALIANFLERAGDMDLSNIDSEEMLKERMEKVFKQKYVKKS